MAYGVLCITSSFDAIAEVLKSRLQMQNTMRAPATVGLASPVFFDAIAEAATGPLKDFNSDALSARCGPSPKFTMNHQSLQMKIAEVARASSKD